MDAIYFKSRSKFGMQSGLSLRIQFVAGCGMVGWVVGGWVNSLILLRQITNLNRCTTFNRFLRLELPRRLISYAEISVKSPVMKRFNLNFCHTWLMDGWMIIVKKIDVLADSVTF